jgi:16S rRNA (adenine1518-N6/adenine1519-N6)-dimethyltransferase
MNPRQILSDLGIPPRKRWSQNFLIEENTSKKIISIAPKPLSNIALEIGPGLGILTHQLCNIYQQVICIELDPILAKYLASFTISNLVIINDDALKVNWKEIITEETRIDLYSNMPYNITGPLLAIIEQNMQSIHFALLTMQDEVAKRLTAPAGSKDRGKLTIILNRQAKISLKHRLPPNAFYPAPQVDSRVILIEPYPDIFDWNEFNYIVTLAFASKRKQVKNNLKSLDKNIIDLLDAAQIKPEARAEDLTIQDFERLTRIWQDRK